MFKLYSLNFAIVHAQEKIVILIRIGHTRVALKQIKTYLSLETSAETNYRIIKFVKIFKLSPFDKNK